MFDKSWTRNALDRSMADAAVEKIEQGDLAAAEAAFNATKGDFAERLLAAVEAALYVRTAYATEPHLRIPDDYESMTVRELDAMIRPYADGFLRSHVSKSELLTEVAHVARRQADHAEWAPYELVDPPARPNP